MKQASQLGCHACGSPTPRSAGLSLRALSGALVPFADLFNHCCGQGPDPPQLGTRRRLPAEAPPPPPTPPPPDQHAEADGFSDEPQSQIHRDAKARTETLMHRDTAPASWGSGRWDAARQAYVLQSDAKCAQRATGCALAAPAC